MKYELYSVTDIRRAEYFKQFFKEGIYEYTKNSL